MTNATLTHARTHTRTHAHTHTHTHGISPRRSSLKHLAMSQLASPALYSLLSSSIGPWARVRNYIQLKKREGVMWELYCENAVTASFPSPLPSPPLSLLPFFHILVRRQRDQRHKRLTGQAHSTSL